MPIPTDEERIGTLVADRYKLDSILGRGGMGVVFEATHTWTGRRVALKLMKPDYASDATGVRRFLQEARTAAKIDHPHVVDVLDMGADAGGDMFLVLERLEGQPLSRLLEDKKRLDALEALELLLPIARALNEAHKLGILHRDIKPDNIFVSRDPEGRSIPKLLDFGMAKIQESAWGNTTASGALLGTPFYMSPEQAEGDPTVGPAADVWSLGAVLYRCLTGRPPFVAPNPTAILLAITRGDLQPTVSLAPNVPPALAAAVERALLPDREERWADMSEFRNGLLLAARESGIELSRSVGGTDGTSEPAVQRTRPSNRGRPSAMIAMVIIAVLGIVLAAVGFGAGKGVSTESPSGLGPPAAQADEGSRQPVSAAAFDPQPELQAPRAGPPPAGPPASEPVQVRIESDPQGATVTLSGELVCTTPCDFDRVLDQDVELTLDAPGRRTTIVTVGPEQIEPVRVALPRARRSLSRVGRSRQETSGRATVTTVDRPSPSTDTEATGPIQRRDSPPELPPGLF